MSAPSRDPDVLIYCKDGWSMVQSQGDGISLATDDAPDSKYTTLGDAFAAAVRAGYNPTRWRRGRSASWLHIDQADHWRSLMERGKL
jgi:hypothetical protein